MEINIREYLQPELLILIPVLNYIGTLLKSSNKIENNHIPAILSIIGIGMSGVWIVSNCSEPNIGMIIFTSIVQGILVTMLSNALADRIKYTTLNTMSRNNNYLVPQLKNPEIQKQELIPLNDISIPEVYNEEVIQSSSEPIAKAEEPVEETEIEIPMGY